MPAIFLSIIKQVRFCAPRIVKRNLILYLTLTCQRDTLGLFLSLIPNANPKFDPRLGHEKAYPPDRAFHEIPARSTRRST